MPQHGGDGLTEAGRSYGDGILFMPFSTEPLGKHPHLFKLPHVWDRFGKFHHPGSLSSGVPAGTAPKPGMYWC
jgi:hypothetical protein